MPRKFFIIAAVSGMLSVTLGAFGAHLLKVRLTPGDLQVFETGVRYQFYHTFALLAVALLMQQRFSKKLNAAAWLFVAGMVCFCGSLYLLALTQSPDFQFLRQIAGPVTPLGGVFFIAGWGSLLASILADGP